ncbi:radical SAM protein [Patescibacteria group bacterium]|nr:radical SAM protein [Patescibacteria group bacterium]
MKQQNPFDTENKLRYHHNHLYKIMDGKRPFPINFEIDVTNHCNHKCIFCNVMVFRREENKSLDKELVKRLLRDLKELGTLSINWTGGGEPLVYKHFEEVVKYSTSLGFKNGLMFNGSLMHKYPEDFFIDNFKWIRVSVAGFDAETYKIFHGKDDFELVINNIKKLNKRIKERKSLLSVGIAHLLKKQNISSLNNVLKDDFYKEIDYIQLRQDMCDYDLKWWKDEVGPWKEKLKNAGITMLGAVFDNYSFTPEPQPCLAHFCVGAVTADGKVKFCKNTRGVKEFDMGDLNQMSLKEIWNSEKVLKMEKSVDCVGCLKYVPSCRNMMVNFYIEDLKNPPWSVNHEFL